MKLLYKLCTVIKVYFLVINCGYLTNQKMFSKIKTLVRKSHINNYYTSFLPKQTINNCRYLNNKIPFINMKKYFFHSIKNKTLFFNSFKSQSHNNYDQDFNFDYRVCILFQFCFWYLQIESEQNEKEEYKNYLKNVSDEYFLNILNKGRKTFIFRNPARRESSYLNTLDDLYDIHAKSFEQYLENDYAVFEEIMIRGGLLDRNGFFWNFIFGKAKPSYKLDESYLKENLISDNIYRLIKLNPKILKNLISKGFKTTNKYNKTFYPVVRWGSSEFCEIILDHNPELVNSIYRPNEPFEPKYTPLNVAIEHNRIDILKLLINKYKADVNLLRPLDTAIFKNNYEIVKILIKNGAYIDYENIKNAFRKGSEKIIDELIDEESERRSRSIYKDETFIHIEYLEEAIENNHEYIFKKYYKIRNIRYISDKHIKDKGFTPFTKKQNSKLLMKALRYNNYEIAYFLVFNAAIDPTFRDEYDQTFSDVCNIEYLLNEINSHK